MPNSGQDQRAAAAFAGAHHRDVRHAATLPAAAATSAPPSSYDTGARFPARPVASPAMSGTTNHSIGARWPRLRLITPMGLTAIVR